MTLEDKVFSPVYTEKNLLSEFSDRWKAALAEWDGKPLKNHSNLILSNNTNELLLLDAEQHQLQKFPIEAPSCWLPRGDGFAFIHSYKEGRERKSSVLEATFDGCVRQVYNSEFAVNQVLYSPDGKSMIFTPSYLVGEKEREDPIKLFHYSFVDDSRTMIANKPGLSIFLPHNGHWSEDSQWISYISESSASGKEIWIRNIVDGTHQRISTGATWNPGFLSENEYVVNFSLYGKHFLLNYEGDIDDGIYIANFNGEGSSSKKLSDEKPFFSINISPDKKYISFIKDNLFSGSVKIISTTPGDITQQDVTLWNNDNPLDSQEHDHYQLVGWSPDSKTHYIGCESPKRGDILGGVIIYGYSLDSNNPIAVSGPSTLHEKMGLGIPRPDPTKIIDTQRSI